MDDVKKLLQSVINGQSALKQELLMKIEQLDKSVDQFDNKMDDGFKDINERFDATDERIDNLRKSLAYLEDDAPTREELDQHEERVSKIETKLQV